MPRIIKKNTHPKADGSREDHWRDFRMCERWMGQQVVQLHGMTMMMMMNITYFYLLYEILTDSLKQVY